MDRSVLLWALVAVMPFSGMRVMCIDPPMSRPVPVEQAEQAAAPAPAEHASDCDRLCPFPRRTADDDAECIVNVAPSSLIVIAGIGLFQVQEAPRARAAPRYHFADSPQMYLDPALTRLNPPPKV